MSLDPGASVQSDGRASPLEAALGYADLGWPVIPCAPGDKRPLLAGGHGWQDGTTDPEQINRWWADEPNANIGIVVGPESGLMVLDIDPRNGGDTSLDQLTTDYGPLPTTLRVRTGGGGWHYYFQHDPRARNGTLLPGVELKADSGYVLAPPSTTTGTYRWASGVARESAPAPEWLLGLRSRTGATGAADTGPITEGGRNQALTSLAGTMRARGMTVEAIRAALVLTNEQRCQPPLPESEVERIATSVARYRPGENGTATRAVAAKSATRLKVTRIASITPRNVEWLWEGRLALGMLNSLEGDPGLGKSTVMYDIAARVSRGAEMPDGTPGPPPAGVVVLTAEDPLDSVVRPRLEAAGADLSRIVTLALEDQHGDREPTICPADLAHVETAIREVGARLVVLDPLVAYLPADINSHRDQDVRRAFAPLRALAERTGACVTFLRHLNKLAGGNALYRGGGSIGIIGAVRSGMVMGLDPDDQQEDRQRQRRVLAPMKSNLGTAPALRLRLVVAAGHENRPGAPIVVIWEGTSGQTAASLLAVPADPEQRDELEAAVEFLRELLVDGGTVSAQEGMAAARAQGHSDRTLQRARVRLRVDAYRETVPGPWRWRLPPTFGGVGGLGGVDSPNLLPENGLSKTANKTAKVGDVGGLGGVGSHGHLDGLDRQVELGGLGGPASNALQDDEFSKTANMVSKTAKVEDVGGLGDGEVAQRFAVADDPKAAKTAKTATQVVELDPTAVDILPLDRFMAAALKQGEGGGQ